MAAINTLRTDSTAAAVTLGDVTLYAEQFSLQVQRKTVQHTLCDGTQRVTLLGELPCTLTLSGRVIPDDGTSLPGSLRALLSGDAAYAFSFRGMAFQDMRITTLSCSAEPQHHEAAVSLTLIGTLKGADSA